jgi:hypothetical protein
MSDFLGAAVENGEIRFFSPTALDRGDPRAGGCALKWWYRYVRRIKEADTDSKDAGRKLHDELARYQKTGDRNLSALAMSGLHMVPTGQDLIVEQPIHQVNGKNISSLLAADGVPIVGWVDHANRRGINMGGDDVTDIQDPPGTIEIIDWKWKRDGSKAEYYATRDQLIFSTQLSGYGLGIGQHFGATHVRLGYGYFPAMRGRPRKVTSLHVLQDCSDNWKYVEGIARHLKSIAKESNPERIEGNKAACGSYGGCPYRDQCPTFKHDSLSSIFGVTAEQEIKMGIDFGQNLAALNAEELKLRMQASQQQVVPGFADACARIQMSGRGFPPLGGAAAQMFAAIGGQSIAPGGTFAGNGEFGRTRVMLNDPFHVLQLAGELVPAVQQVQQVLPPDAPASNPAFAAKSVEGFSFPPSHPALPTPAPVETIAEAPAAKKRGRPPKAADAPTTPMVTQDIPTGQLRVFINCMPNCEYESLHPYVDNIIATLVARFCAPPALPDLRCAPKDGPLGFGAWKGAIRAIVLEQPPPAGTYYLLARGDDYAEEVATAMLTVCNKATGLYVRGA